MSKHVAQPRMYFTSCSVRHCLSFSRETLLQFEEWYRGFRDALFVTPTGVHCATPAYTPHPTRQMIVNFWVSLLLTRCFCFLLCLTKP